MLYYTGVYGGKVEFQITTDAWFDQVLSIETNLETIGDEGRNCNMPISWKRLLYLTFKPD